MTLSEGLGVLAAYARILAAWPGRAGKPERLEPERILVLGYSRIGDLIFLLPALEALRGAWPKARITFVANRYPSHLELLPATGLVDEQWHYELEDFDDPAKRREIEGRVRGGGFDVAIVNQATRLRAFAAPLLSIPVRVGHCTPVAPASEGWSWPTLKLWQLRRAIGCQELERRLALNRKVWLAPGGHAVERNLALVKALGIETKPALRAKPKIRVAPEFASAAKKALPDAPGRRTIGLHLGAVATTGYSKLWPAERWGQAFESVASDTPLRVAVFGGAEEKSSLASFRRAFTGEALDFVGEPKLMEAFALIARCELFCSSDTGLSKAAMALGVPTVAVWGPVERAGYGAIWDRERHTEVFREMPCSPCVRFGLPLEGPGVINYIDCGHHDCLAKLDVSAVAAAIRRRLAAA